MMCTDDNSKCNDLNREILKGRIWPAIQSCVGNRYKIVISFFAFYSFIMTSTIQSIRTRFDDIKLYTSIIFTLLTLLNSYNYIRNSAEQRKIEDPHANDSYRKWIKRNDVELSFFVIMMALIWGSFLLIKN